MSKPIVIIDPGHGGSDSGAPGGFQGIEVNEKDIVLKIALALKQQLQPDFTVHMTRSTDVFIELDDRAVFANNKAAGKEADAVFISIHADSVQGHDDATGYTVYRKPQHHLTFARKIEKRLKELWTSHGYSSDRSETIRENNFQVLRETATIPGVLAEAGFIDSEHDCSRLATKQHQEELAEALRLGICDHFNICGEYTVTGKVLSSLSRRGLTQIRITATDTHSTISGETSRGGNFSIALPRSGNWTFTFEDIRSTNNPKLSGYETKSVSADITNNNTVLQDVLLERKPS